MSADNLLVVAHHPTADHYMVFMCFMSEIFPPTAEQTQEMLQESAIRYTAREQTRYRQAESIEDGLRIAREWQNELEEAGGVLEYGVEVWVSRSLHPLKDAS